MFSKYVNLIIKKVEYIKMSIYTLMLQMHKLEIHVLKWTYLHCKFTY